MKLHEVADVLIEKNNIGFNILKLIEETTELNEVLLKYLSKPDALKPSLQSIVDEAGDVVLRLHIVMETLCLTGKLNEKLTSKCEEILAFFEEEVAGRKLVITPE